MDEQYERSQQFKKEQEARRYTENASGKDALPAPEITMQATELSDNTHRLYETLSKLQDRIGYCLDDRPRPCGTESAAQEVGLKTALGRQMASINEGVKASLELAHDMLRRCEL